MMLRTFKELSVDIMNIYSVLSKQNHAICTSRHFSKICVFSRLGKIEELDLLFLFWVYKTFINTIRSSYK